MSDIGYTPSDNSNNFGGTNSAPLTGPSPLAGVTAEAAKSYASVSTLENGLTTLMTVMSNYVTGMQNYLKGYALAITPGDTKLSAAVAATWPSSLGSAPNAVGFRYYDYLVNQDSAAARFICGLYEDAIRDVKGSNALDLLQLAQAIYDEASYIYGFVLQHVQGLSDSSQQRTVELHQEWVETALSYAGQFGVVFNQGIQGQGFQPSDLSGVSAETARQAQALFKVKLNLLNNQLATNLGSFRQLFVDYAPVFYNNYLVPAILFRKTTSNRVFPDSKTALGIEMTTAVNALNANLDIAITDLLRRNSNFDNKVNELLNQIQERDKYRAYINQLTTISGMDIPIGSSGTVIPYGDSSDQIQFFDTAHLSATPSYSFVSAHAELDELGADDHPQYVLKSGGEMTGDLTLASGVRVDGIQPSTHAHTGSDGSAQIDGANIIGGTLGVGAIDPNSASNAPTDLTLISLTPIVTTPGGVTVDALVQWQGSSDQSLTYEVQIAKI